MHTPYKSPRDQALLRPLHRMMITLLGLSLGLFAANTVSAQTPSDPFNYSRSSSFTYDPATGLLLTETVEPNNPQSCVTTSYQYDSYGNKISATTSNCSGASGRALFTSRSSTSSYTSQTVAVAGTSGVVIPAGAYPVTVKNALNQAETKTFDPRFGAVVGLIGPNNLPTNWQIDDFGRKTREIRSDGTSTISAYCYLSDQVIDTTSNSPNCPTPSSDEIPKRAVSFIHAEPHNLSDVKNGPFTRIYMDGAGHTLRSVTEAYDGATQIGGSTRRIVQDTDYTAQGVAYLKTQPYFLDTLTSVSSGGSGYGMVQTSFDALGRPITIITSDPKGNGSIWNSRSKGRASVASFSYKGLITTSTNDKGQTRVEEKNVDGKVVRITDAIGGQIAHQYDAFGNLVKTKDAMQNVVSISYDIRGRKTGMVDPDTGNWQYDYDALGQLVWQQSPNQRILGQSTTIQYDILGRMVQRTEPEYVSSWSYDKYADGSSCNAGIGKLCESNTTNGINRKVVYDNLGRATTTRTGISNGPSFASSVAYDSANGRLVTQTYPTGLTVSYNYTTKGFLANLSLVTAATVNPLPAVAGGTPGPSTNLAANSMLWQAGSYNAWGKAETQSYGNGVISQANFDALTGRIDTSTAGLGTSTNIVNYSYTWDSLNHLMGRTDANGDGTTGAVTDGFFYDDIGRLQSYNVASPTIPSLQRNVTLQYNGLGSIIYKSDVGTYTYPVQGGSVIQPHALLSVSGTVNNSFGYDANGNLTSATSGSYRKISYNSFNLPDSQNGMQGPNGSPQYTWQYDENHQRIKETRTNSTGTRITWMLHPDNAGGLAFESEQSNGSISNRHYLSVGGTSIGVLVSTGNLPTLAAGQMSPAVLSNITLAKVEYWHKDHLGSLIATTDHTGAVTARYSYDPFGKRRTASGNYDANGQLIIDWTTNTNNGTDRGYTGHEHLDDMGVIHMNGRIYDPLLGRFMQGDPFIQDPSNLQNFNRYGYCYNNPMTCTDPTGQLFGIDDMFFVALIAIWGAEKAGIIDARTARQITSIAFTIASGVPQNIASAAETGFISGAISSGNLKGALQGGFTAGMFFGAGNVLAGGDFFGSAVRSTSPNLWSADWAKGVALHGVVGCVTSEVGGGKCGPGALSAAFSKALAPVTGKLTDENPVAGATISAVAGGTGSVLGGGKFSNGATTGAFGYLYNHWAHSLELAMYGIDAHKALQQRMYDLGYVVERSAAGGFEVNGRFDIADATTKELWEIKRYSIPGIAAGEIALRNYTENTGFIRGGDLIGLKVGETIWLNGVKDGYTFLNLGGGLIVYKQDSATIKVQVPNLFFFPSINTKKSMKLDFP